MWNNVLLLQEESLEVSEVAGHGDALLRTLHEGLQTFGYLDIDTKDVVDLLLELCWMGGLTEDAHLSGLQLLLECTVAAGTVWVEDVARLFIALAHSLTYLLVAVGSTADERGDALVGLFWRKLTVLAVEVDDASEVRWIAHVHRVGQRLYGRLRFVTTGLQVVIEHVVGVVGSDESLDGQAHLVTEEGGTDVAEVA